MTDSPIDRPSAGAFAPRSPLGRAGFWMREQWRAAAESDLWYSFRRSPVTIVAALITLIFVLGSIFAPLSWKSGRKRNSPSMTRSASASRCNA